MPLSSFHPVVARWFEHRFGEPTAPQRSGWGAIRAGRDTLISAPTGSGKTLAAFLHSLDQLFREGLEAPLPDDLHQALRLGWEDFKAVPSHAIILCVIYPVLGLVLARTVLGYSVLPLLFPLAAGFALPAFRMDTLQRVAAADGAPDM